MKSYTKPLIIVLIISVIIGLSMFLFSGRSTTITEDDFFNTTTNEPRLKLVYTVNKQSEPVIAVIEPNEKKVIKDGIATKTELYETLPFLLNNSRYTVELAEALNHLARGNDYTVISDPEAYRATYTAEFNATEEKLEFDPNDVNQRSFGRANVSLIAAPKIQDNILTFYAQSKSYSYPYVVTFNMTDAEAQPSYEPIPTISLD